MPAADTIHILLASLMTLQTSLPPHDASTSEETLASTEYVSCFHEPQGSRRVRSPVLVSPNGFYRAYVEVEVVSFLEETDVPVPACTNTSKLFLSEKGQEDFRLVYLEEPKKWSGGNGLRLADWSPDGDELLIELFVWQYESDVFGKDILVYLPRHGIFRVLDYRWYQRRFQTFTGAPPDCSVEISAIGFSPEGDIVVKAQPEIDEEMYGTSCVQEEGLWLLDPYGKTATPLPPDYKVKQYGKIEGHEPEE